MSRALYNGGAGRARVSALRDRVGHVVELAIGDADGDGASAHVVARTSMVIATGRGAETSIRTIELGLASSLSAGRATYSAPSGPKAIATGKSSPVATSSSDAGPVWRTTRQRSTYDLHHL